MVTKITRRMRCEITSCKQQAVYGIGYKGLDFMMCEAHFKELIKAGNRMSKTSPGSFVIPEPQPEPVETAPAIEEIEPVATEVAAEPEAPEEFYTCKWCGQKFSKRTMTGAQFMQHSKACKKEHGGK